MSSFTFFSKNGKILPITQAVVSLANIEYSYGYGVYETLKVRNNILYFVEQHLERLEHSANVLGIMIPFSKKEITTYLYNLIEQLKVDACNIKILLIGGHDTTLYIFATAPLYPDRKLYKNGTSLLSYTYERLFPSAKTLNMLPSYLAYKKAKEHDCYDALLIDHQGILLEGTRTNFCLVKNNTIFMAPQQRILAGVTFLTLAKIAEKEHFTIVEQETKLQDLSHFDGAFITSTSTKIMPVVKIDSFSFASIPDTIKRLMNAYDKFLEESKGIF